VEARKKPANRIGTYTLVRELGRGGTGVVHRAWDEELGRWVAIKMLLPHSSAPEDLERFRREGKTAARLEHPNILPIYDVETIGGTHYIVTKFVDGRTLDTAGLKEVRDVVRVLREACRGVAHAHRSGVVHRDLKPQNIMIDRDGRVVVLDFGLAKTLEAKGPSLTATQGLMGTPAFMSPEQARGMATEIDMRTDVYSMTATLWFALSGLFPHRGESPQDIMVKIATEPTPSVRQVRPDVPERLDSLLLKGMAKKREDRYADCEELGEALEQFLRDPGFARKSRAWVLPLLLLLLGGGIAFGVFRWWPRRAPDPGPTPAGKADFDPRRFGEVRSREAHESWVRCLAFSPDGARAASGGKDGAIKIWDGESGAPVSALSGHGGMVMSLAFSPDGKRIASSGEDNAVKIWKVPERKEERTLRGHGRSLLGVMAVAFAPDGARLASGGYDGTIRIWKTDTGEELLVLRGHGKGVVSLGFSPDGSKLASSSDDTTVRIWDLAAGGEPLLLLGHTGWIWCVSFDRDGRTLASGGDDRAVKIWNPTTGKEIRALHAHTDSVKQLSFHPTQPWLASAGDDASVRIWDLSTGKEVRTLTGHADQVWALAWQPNGRGLLSGSADRTMRWWGEK